MKSCKRTLFIILAVITVLSLVLSACGPIDGSGNDSDNGTGKDKPKDKDKGNGNDKNKPDNPNKVTICHKTGSSKNPYVEISVANDALNDGHGTHENDIIPAPEDGCPTE